MTDDFYRAFEERFRGSRDLIKSRQRVYLPFIEPLLFLYKDAKAIDLGCGRGEWLEILRESGFNGHGVDIDDGMLTACRDYGLSVATQDALSALKALPDESQVIVSGFHIAEHIDISNLGLLIQQAHRVLKPAGMLILETPNPENITVGTVNFYLDPTHQKPIPPELLSFLPQYYGFTKVKIVRLQEDTSLATSAWTLLRDIWGGVSPDYAVIAQKAAEATLLDASDAAFAKDYGLTPGVLIDKFDQQSLQANERAIAAEAHALQAGERAIAADTLALQANERATAAQANALQASEQAVNVVAALHAMHLSRSWRLTAPLRKAGHIARVLIQRSKALQPRVKRQIRSLLTRAADPVNQHPKLRHAALVVLSRFPALKTRLKAAVMKNDLAPAYDPPPVPTDLSNLTPHALQIYMALKNKMDHREKERN